MASITEIDATFDELGQHRARLRLPFMRRFTLARIENDDFAELSKP